MSVIVKWLKSFKNQKWQLQTYWAVAPNANCLGSIRRANDNSEGAAEITINVQETLETQKSCRRWCFGQMCQINIHIITVTYGGVSIMLWDAIFNMDWKRMWIKQDTGNPTEIEDLEDRGSYSGQKTLNIQVDIQQNDFNQSILYVRMTQLKFKCEIIWEFLIA